MPKNLWPFIRFEKAQGVRKTAESSARVHLFILRCLKQLRRYVNAIILIQLLNKARLRSFEVERRKYITFWNQPSFFKVNVLSSEWFENWWRRKFQLNSAKFLVHPVECKTLLKRVHEHVLRKWGEKIISCSVCLHVSLRRRQQESCSRKSQHSAPWCCSTALTWRGWIVKTNVLVSTIIAPAVIKCNPNV